MAQTIRANTASSPCALAKDHKWASRRYQCTLSCFEIVLTCWFWRVSKKSNDYILVSFNHVLTICTILPAHTQPILWDCPFARSLTLQVWASHGLLDVCSLPSQRLRHAAHAPIARGTRGFMVIGNVS